MFCKKWQYQWPKEKLLGLILSLGKNIINYLEKKLIGKNWINYFKACTLGFNVNDFKDFKYFKDF